MSSDTKQRPPADSPEVVALVTSTLELVEIVARSMKRTIPRADLDDMRSAGREGLLRAARSYDSSHGVPFRSFASFRIRGAIIDGLRSTSALSRHMYDRLRAYERAEEIAVANAENDAAAPKRTAEEADAVLAERLSQAAVAMALGFLGQRGGDALDDVRDERSEELEVEKRILLRRVEEIMAERPETEREILRLHYFEDLSLEEVGAKLGLHKSWVSRVMARTVESLSRELGPRPPIRR